MLIQKYSSFFILIAIINLIQNSFQVSQEGNKPIKRMIITLIPGGHSHNIVVQNLLDYTLLHEDEFKYEYYIISHKTSSEIWEQKIKSNKNINKKINKYMFAPILKVRDVRAERAHGQTARWRLRAGSPRGQTRLLAF